VGWIPISTLWRRSIVVSAGRLFAGASRRRRRPRRGSRRALRARCVAASIATLLIASLLLAAPAGAAGPTPLIIDSDLFSNADDVAALATAFALQIKGEDQVIAITLNTRTDRPSVAVNTWKCAAAIAQFYNSASVPIGADMPDNGAQVGSPDFITPCAALASPSTPAPASAVSVLRQALAGQADGSVVIAEIGYQENLAALLNSSPDGVSSLNGHDLIAQKVKELVVMGGGYPSYPSGENNLAGNPVAAADVAANWPTKVVWSGIEVGNNVFGGHTVDSAQPLSSPVRVAMDAYAGPNPSFSLYDPTAVYHAVRPGDALLTESLPGQNVVNGGSGANAFTLGTGNQFYLKLTNAGTMDSTFESLFDVLPSGVLPPPPPPPVPSALTPPLISGATNQGQTLTENHGSWSNGPTGYSYQWEDCDSKGNNCSPVAGAAGPTYLLSGIDLGSTIRVVETAKNSTGLGSPAASVPTAVVGPPAPVDLSLPTIAGAAGQGQTLTESHGSWSNSPTGYAYQWEDCDSAGNNCFAIAGATGQGYLLTAADVGHMLRVAETASNPAGPGNAAVSAATQAVSAATPVIIGGPVLLPVPASSGPPSISGHTARGQRLVESHAIWSSSPTGFAYQWERCSSTGSNCHPIASATGQGYTLGAGDVGSTIRVIETASNVSGAGGPANSSATGVVNGPPAAGQGPHKAAPDTRLVFVHISSKLSSAKFRFKATGVWWGFRCALVRVPSRRGAKTPSPSYSGCRSTKTFTHLRPGRYVLYVRAAGPGGPDASPVRYAFTIV
jgi:inosine-uridine nucleoside N-ribohydrolase